MTDHDEQQREIAIDALYDALDRLKDEHPDIRAINVIHAIMIAWSALMAQLLNPDCPMKAIDAELQAFADYFWHHLITCDHCAHPSIREAARQHHPIADDDEVTQLRRLFALPSPPLPNEG
jgi:hypothetical protein